MYQQIYQLLQNVVFETTTLTANEELILTLVSTVAVLFVIAIPFIVVWKVIKMVCGG